MKTILFKTIFLAFLIVHTGISNAQQKGIIIPESLAANSEAWKVKMGTQWMGKIWKIRFGDYVVTDSKMGWITTSYKSNMFNTKSESKTTQKFAFTLSNNTGDFAKVNAAIDIEVKVLKETELFSFLSIGEDEILLDSRNFTAMININQDTTETWILFMNINLGSTVEEGGTAFLSNKDRKILITSAQSNASKGAFSSMLPAMGYEFQENDETLGAVQYFGGGAMGTNKNMVWIDNRLDSKMKLILAAAMTAIIQLEN